MEQKNKVARLIVTKACNRSCPGCCNDTVNFKGVRKIKSVTELIDYESICLTGGEPMLVSAECSDICDTLRMQDYKGKIYLYTAMYRGYTELEDLTLLSFLDGVNYTIHDEPSEYDWRMLLDITERLSRENVGVMHNVLRIDSRVQNQCDNPLLNLAWDEIRTMEWKEDCPLPEGEELLIWEPR